MVSHRSLKDAFTPVARLALLLAMLSLAGCSTAPKWQSDAGLPSLLADETVEASGTYLDPSPLPRVEVGARPAYRLGPQDELMVTVWGPREVWSEVTPQSGQVSRALVVQDDGTIVVPLLRRVKVEGLTMPEALARVADGYRNVAGSNFQVDGSLTRTRSRAMLVEGAVLRPGIAYLGPDTVTLGDAIGGVAGGLQEGADPSRGVLYRSGKAYRLDYQRSQQGAGDLHRIELQAGDRVFFPSRATGVFYIFGEVGNQGSFPIPPGGVTLLQAIAQAKGPQLPTANMQSIFLVRPGADKPRIYQLTLEEIIATRDLPLAPGDRVFVPATGLTDWERTVRQLIPLFGAGAAITSGVAN